VWLPTKERKLLAIYAERAESYGKAFMVSNEEIIKFLNLKDERELFNLESKLWFKGFLNFPPSDKPRKEKYENGKPAGTEEYGEPQISLTDKGYNIGLKYGTIFELWSRENIWFWVVLGVFISALGIGTTIAVAFIKD